MKKPFQLRSILLILVGLCITILVVDYFNIPSKLGFNIRYLNLDLQSIVLNSFLTVGMFALAYYLIDQWEAKKNKNKESIAKQLLKTSYMLCKEYTEQLDRGIYSNLFRASRHVKNNGKPELDIPFLRDYENSPFESHDMIIQFCTEGILSIEQFNDYIRIKNLFAAYVNVYGLFVEEPDKWQDITCIKKDLIDEIRKAISKLS